MISCDVYMETVVFELHGYDIQDFYSLNGKLAIPPPPMLGVKGIFFLM